MRYCMIFGLIALANSLTALDSFLIDDPLSLEIDEISQTLPNDEWWTVGPDDAEVDSYWSSMIFEEPEPSPYSFLSDELSNTYLNEDIPEDIFALGNDCSSTFAPSRRIRSRADDQCFNPQSDANIDDQLIRLVNERIKRQWCSKEPWIGFGNIPVTRLVGTEAVPVEPDVSLPDLSVPPLKVFTLPGAVLLTFTIELFYHATDVWCCDFFIPEALEGALTTPLVEGVGYFCFPGSSQPV